MCVFYSGLAVVGRHIEPVILSDTPGIYVVGTKIMHANTPITYTHSLFPSLYLSPSFSEEAALREEILAQHGHLEEYLAFDCR